MHKGANWESSEKLPMLMAKNDYINIWEFTWLEPQIRLFSFWDGGLG